MRACVCVCVCFFVRVCAYARGRVCVCVCVNARECCKCERDGVHRSLYFHEWNSFTDVYVCI